MITEKEIDSIAFLARLEIEEKDKPKYAEELSNILQFVEKINQLDLRNVEPTSHILNLQNVMREDSISPSYSPEKILSNAPQQKNDFIVVPKTV